MKSIMSNWWPINVNIDEKLKILRSKVNQLSAQQSDILTAVDNAEIQPGKKRKREVECWFKDVVQKKTELQEIESEYRDQGPSSRLKNRIETETKKVEELIQWGKFPNGVVLDDHASLRLPLVTRRLVGQSPKGNFESICKWLKEDDVFAIGVHGMGGVGKTTLLKKIHNVLLTDSAISGQVYWVTASKECSIDKLQMDIGKALSLDLLHKDEERRKALLFHRFSQLKKSVLILDDMWKHYPADKIGIPLKSGCCKIVLTTRSLDVCRRMGCRKVIKVESLSCLEAWKLFIETWGSPEELPSDIKPIAEGVVKECGGLPLALITMGSSMRGVSDVHNWRQALLDLTKPMSRQDDMEDDVFKILKFSFDSLKDAKLQACFLSCVLYPEDEKIYREELIDLWIMEEMFDDIENRQDRVVKGHGILNRLENSNLLEAVMCGDERCVKMHDLIRDMAIIITQNHSHFMAKSGLQLTKAPAEELWTRDLVKVSLRNNNIEKLPYDMSPRCPTLSVLMLCHNYYLKAIPDPFFAHMMSLTVVDLSSTGIEMLPNNVSDLVNLRGLLLGGCARLRYVPSLAKLTNLMVLDLPLTGEIEEAPRGMEILNCLEKISCYWNVSDLDYFNTVIKSWQICTCCYQIQLRGCGKYFNFFEFGEKKNKVVGIIGVEYGQKEPKFLLPHSTECVWLENCTMKEKGTLGDVWPSLGHVTELKELGIDKCRGLEYVWSTTGPEWSFSPQHDTLESLMLAHLCELKGIIKVGEGDTKSLQSPSLPPSPQLAPTFSHLKELSVSTCPKIKVLFQVKLPLHQPILPNLEIIGVYECEDLEEIIQLGGGSKWSYSHTKDDKNPPIFSLPKLKWINLDHSPKLWTIYRGPLLCPSLKNIEIGNCLKLKHRLSWSAAGLVYDTSPATLSSIPTDTDNPGWWEPLHQYYPDGAAALSDLVNHFQKMFNPLPGQYQDHPLLDAEHQREIAEKKWLSWVSQYRPRLSGHSQPLLDDDQNFPPLDDQHVPLPDDQDQRQMLKREWAATLSLSS